MLDSLFINFSGQQATDSYDATVETLKAIPHQVSKQIQILVEMCAFAGTGNVLKVQSMLHYCDEHIGSPNEKEKEKEKEEGQAEGEKEEEVKVDDTFQAFAVLGISLVAMGEDIGAEMSLRQFNHLVRSFSMVLLHHVEANRSQ